MIGCILNYGVGNLYSVKKAFESTGKTRIYVKEVDELLKDDLMKYTFIILPGVGHFSVASKKLEPLKEELVESHYKGLGVFGICLGLQLLGRFSEEGPGIGLELLEGDSVKLPSNVKIPHMGWNKVIRRGEHQIFEGIEKSFFYFAHSYYLNLSDESVVGVTKYGVEFPSIVADDLLIGVQFHPEKSGVEGLRIISNYIEMLKR